MKKIKPANKAKVRELPAKFEAGFLRDIDKRTDIYQRLNTNFENIIADAGGFDAISHTKLALIERFVFLEVQIQIWELQILSNSKKADELGSRWVQACNTLTGLAKTIGLKRVSKVQTLQSYVAARTTA